MRPWGDQAHDRSGADEEGYAVLRAGCEGGERDGTRPLIPHAVLCKVRLVRAWINSREVVVMDRRMAKVFCSAWE